MKKKTAVSILAAVSLILSLAACSGSTTTSQSASEPAAGAEEAVTTEAQAPVEEPVEEAVEAVTTETEINAVEAATEAPAESAAEFVTQTAAAAQSGGTGVAAEVAAEETMLENGGVVVPVPTEYLDLLEIETLKDDENGMLFRFSDKASIEVVKEMGEDYDGAGWLFGIGKVSSEKVPEMLCNDMTGQEIFAKDEEGNSYVYYHPTDVTVMRNDMSVLKNPEDPWNILSAWAGTVKDTIVNVNPGFTADKHTNTQLDMYLAQIEYEGFNNYTISTTEFGPMDPADVDPAPYVDRFVNGATFNYTEEEEAPDGEYVVLTFPEEDLVRRYDFFFAEGKQNIVREVMEYSEDGETYETLYEVSFAAEEAGTANEIMNEWYHALAEAHGYTSEEAEGATAAPAEETAEP